MSGPDREFIGNAPELRWVPIDMIIVDDKYQREIVTSRVRKIVKNFKWHYFGAITLAEQIDGLYTVYDGQHRVMAADQHPAITEVPAIIVKLDGSRQEADAFVVVNKERSSISAISTYWAGIHAENTEMVRVQTVLANVGVGIARSHADKGPNKTTAVGAVTRSIRNYGEKAVGQAVSVLIEVWPNDRRALQGNLICAMSRVFRDNLDINEDHLLCALSRQSLFDLTTSAEAIKKISGGSAEVAISRSIVEAYNRGNKRNQIVIGGGK